MSLPITSENNNKEREPSLSISPPLTLPQMHEMRMKKDKYLEQFNFSHCEDANKYVLTAKIGQGTFGEVFKARSKKNPSLIVAMKKIMMECERNGFPMTALREIRILQQLRHHNIVRLLEICQTKENKFSVSHSAFFLIFEFCEHDLFGLLSNINLKFDIGIIKNIIQQILNGLHFIHTNMILHRDLKPANILIKNTGVLKLADFGLARAFSVKKSVQFKRKYTNNVVTLWYRAPELLLGEHDYGPPIDLWSAGCILGEMWTRLPILQGQTEQSQLMLISELCGSFVPEVWPAVVSLPLYNKIEFSTGYKPKIKDHFESLLFDPLAIDLLEKLLTLDPEKRINAHSALDHQFFWTDPMPHDLFNMMSRLQTSNYEYLTKQRYLYK